MEKRSDIQIEMGEISPAVAAVANINVYTIAENYFTGFAARVMMQLDVKEFDNKLLAQPPSGYFDGLADAVLTRIKKENTALVNNETEQELFEVAPLLATVLKANVYTVPENYFSQFKVEPSLKPATGKVLPFAFKKWAGFAAAAVTAGIIIIAAFFSNNSTGINNTSLNVNKSVAEISDNEINNYLDKTSESNDIALTAGYELQPNEDTDVEDFINLAPDKDIEDYLQSNSEPDENPLKGI